MIKASLCKEFCVETSLEVQTKPAGPGRPGLTFEAYEQAYQELTGEDGIPPSQRQLRKYLGTGSNTTLANYRQRLTENQITDGQLVEQGTADAELLVAVRRFANQIALDEAKVANDRVEEIQKSAENKVRIAESTMEKRLSEVNVLEHRANQAEADLKELRAEVKAKDTTLSVAVEKHEALMSAHMKLTNAHEDAIRESNNRLLENSELQKEIVKVSQTSSEEIGLARSTIAKLKENLTEMNNKYSDSQQSNVRLTERSVGLKDKYEEQNRVIESYVSRLSENNVRINQLISKNEDALKHFEKINNERDQYSKKCSDLSIRLDAERKISVAYKEGAEAESRNMSAQLEYLKKTILALTPGTSEK